MKFSKIKLILQLITKYNLLIFSKNTFRFQIISCIINKLYALHGTQIKQDTGNINPGQNLEDADIKNIFSKLGVFIYILFDIF